MYQIVLGSTSVYRKALLEKLYISFVTAKPNIDETPKTGETPHELVSRLAESKAKAITTDKDSLIIGSDQVAVLDGNILGKPGSQENAIEQLMAASGKRVTFLTGLCLYNTKTEKCQTLVEPFNVEFKTLTRDIVADYVEKENPVDCAGSFKSEGLGIALFNKLEGDDPNSLIGLPLIKLVTMLENEGFNVLGAA